MPRHESNNPSVRMGKVLDDFDALEATYEETMTLIAEASPTLFEKLPPKPSCEAIIAERTRRQITLGQVASNRKRMRHIRQLPSRSDLSTPHKLSPEDEAAIIRELERGDQS